MNTQSNASVVNSCAVKLTVKANVLAHNFLISSDQSGDRDLLADFNDDDILLAARATKSVARRGCFLMELKFRQASRLADATLRTARDSSMKHRVVALAA